MTSRTASATARPISPATAARTRARSSPRVPPRCRNCSNTTFVIGVSVTGRG